MRGGRSFRECVGRYPGNGQFPCPLFTFHAEFGGRPDCPSYHSHDLFIALAGHSGAIHRQDFVSMAEPRSMGRALRMHHSDIQYSGIADPFRADMERDTDHAFGQIGFLVLFGGRPGCL